MTKKDFAERVGKATGLMTRTAGKTVDVIFAEIAGAITKTGGMMLMDFGRFRVVRRAARTVRHPRTGEKLKIMAHKVVVFRQGRGLKYDLNHR